MTPCKYGCPTQNNIGVASIKEILLKTIIEIGSGKNKLQIMATKIMIEKGSVSSVFSFKLASSASFVIPTIVEESRSLDFARDDESLSS